ICSTDTAPPVNYTLSLHDALPISQRDWESGENPDRSRLILRRERGATPWHRKACELSPVVSHACDPSKRHSCACLSWPVAAPKDDSRGLARSTPQCPAGG